MVGLGGVVRGWVRLEVRGEFVNSSEGCLLCSGLTMGLICGLLCRTW